MRVQSLFTIATIRRRQKTDYNSNYKRKITNYRDQLSFIWDVGMILKRIHKISMTSITGSY